MSFYYEEKGSSLWRSAQNNPGLLYKRCKEDEEMLKFIGHTNPNTSTVIIYDARSSVKAMSNKFKGGGYENTDYYKN